MLWVNTFVRSAENFGDILWSLPTAKFIAEKVVGQPVDFAVMPYYESLLPLLQEQEYIDKAFVIKDWICTGSPHGDQPCEAPIKENGGTYEAWLVRTPSYSKKRVYEKVWHLGYRAHPGIGGKVLPLIDFIADQQGIKLENPVPFLTCKDTDRLQDEPFVATAFNDQYADEKAAFFNLLVEAVPGVLIDLRQFDWLTAARHLANKHCIAFIGDRSANWVLAKGLDKLCITYEPNPSRSAGGMFGKVFSCPYGQPERPLPSQVQPQFAAKFVAGFIQNKLKELQTMEVT